MFGCGAHHRPAGRRVPVQTQHRGEPLPPLLLHHRAAQRERHAHAAAAAAAAALHEAVQPRPPRPVFRRLPLQRRALPRRVSTSAGAPPSKPSTTLTPPRTKSAQPSRLWRQNRSAPATRLRAASPRASSSWYPTAGDGVSLDDASAFDEESEVVVGGPHSTTADLRELMTKKFESSYVPTLDDAQVD
jgi:hypothetical protein